MNKNNVPRKRTVWGSKGQRLAELRRKTHTPAELKLHKNLKKYFKGHFVREWVIGRYRLDFFFQEPRIGIEVDGSYHFSDEQQKRDNQKDSFCRKNDIKIIRFHNDEIINNVDKVIEKIRFNISNQDGILLNEFLIEDAHNLQKYLKTFELYTNIEWIPENIDQEFFKYNINKYADYDTIPNSENKFFKYVVSYLRWLKTNKPNVDEFIKRYELLKDTITKSDELKKIKLVKERLNRRKESLEQIQKLKETLNTVKSNQNKIKIRRSIETNSGYYCSLCKIAIPTERLQKEPSTILCINCASKHPSSKKNRFIKDTFGSRKDYAKDRASWKKTNS